MLRRVTKSRGGKTIDMLNDGVCQISRRKNSNQRGVGDNR